NRAATLQTATNHTSGAAACFASSSSGSAWRTRGPGNPFAWITYSHPVVATTTASTSGGSASLRAIPCSQVLARGEVRVGGISAPERPVMAPVDDAEAVGDAVRCELGDERHVLVEEAIVAAGVQPEEGVRSA